MPGRSSAGPAAKDISKFIREYGTILAAQGKREIVVSNEKGREAMVKTMFLLGFATIILFVSNVMRGSA